MPRMSRGPKRRRVRYCIYCRHKFEPDYKDTENLGNMISDRGKIIPRRLSGLCAKHQRRTATEVKHARHMAILPFVAENIR